GISCWIQGNAAHCCGAYCTAQAAAPSLHVSLHISPRISLCISLHRCAALLSCYLFVTAPLKMRPAAAHGMQFESLIPRRNAMAKLFKWLTMTVLATMLTACGYNDFQAKDEATKAAWSEVVNQYQRRADLIPNLVNTVKGYASHERETLESVTKA